MVKGFFFLYYIHSHLFRHIGVGIIEEKRRVQLSATVIYIYIRGGAIVHVGEAVIVLAVSRHSFVLYNCSIGTCMYEVYTFNLLGWSERARASVALVEFCD